jgi:lipoyl-dependent peroxiredoxin
MSIEKVLYTARARATDGRDGRAVSADGILDFELPTPRECRGRRGNTSDLTFVLDSEMGELLI